MEQLAEFLRKAGYTVSKGGTEHFSSEFLTVLKDALPIGFILSDYSAITTSAESQKTLDDITAFWKTYSTLSPRGQSEFLLLYWKGNEITTNFDIQSGRVNYNLYLRGKESEVLHSLDEAMQKMDRACPITYRQVKEAPKQEEVSEAGNSKKRFLFWHKRKNSASHEVAT